MSERWFLHARQVIPECSVGGSSLHGMWFWYVSEVVAHAQQVIPDCPPHGSGTCERWFRHGRQVIPDRPPGGSGIASS
ncbi:hypothetical protein BTM453_15370 [Helicobacter pylori]